MKTVGKEAPVPASTETSIQNEHPAETVPATPAAIAAATETVTGAVVSPTPAIVSPDGAVASSGAAIVSPTAPTEAPPPAVPQPKVRDGHQPFEAWAKTKKTPAVWLNAARAANKWATGREVTEAVYDAAIDAAQKVESR